MEKEFTKSYAINRIAELLEELERLKEINLYNNEQLKQQLTEANKEIEYMNASSDWQSLLILKQEMEILQTENKVLKRRNQDKISLCIEKLNEVKAKFGYKFNSQLMVSSKGLCKYIDNQIKELKKDNN